MSDRKKERQKAIGEGGLGCAISRLRYFLLLEVTAPFHRVAVKSMHWATPVVPVLGRSAITPEQGRFNLVGR